MVQILAATVSTTLAGLGWLISRWLQKDAFTELMDRRLKLVALLQRMSQAGLSMRDLERLEQELRDGNVLNPEQNIEKSRRIRHRPIVHANRPLNDD